MAGAGTSSPQVIAVVVTHRPDIRATARLLAALAPQVAHVVVVDNGSPAETVTALREALSTTTGELVSLAENVGIAAAQNVGITRARAGGATHILLSDQDSLPARATWWRSFSVAWRAPPLQGAASVPSVR